MLGQLFCSPAFFLIFLRVVARLPWVCAMLQDIISGETDSVIISTGGLPEVPGTSFSQPISAVEIRSYSCSGLA